jgi:hypothetical protein
MPPRSFRRSFPTPQTEGLRVAIPAMTTTEEQALACTGHHIGEPPYVNRTTSENGSV